MEARGRGVKTDIGRYFFFWENFLQALRGSINDASPLKLLKDAHPIFPHPGRNPGKFFRCNLIFKVFPTSLRIVGLLLKRPLNPGFFRVPGSPRWRCLSKSGFEFFTAFFGVLYAGGVPTPMRHDHGDPDRIRTWPSLLRYPSGGRNEQGTGILPVP